MLVIHLGFCTSDVLNCNWTKMSLNKKREMSAIALDWGFLFRMESGQIPSISVQFDWPLLEPEAAMLVT